MEWRGEGRAAAWKGNIGSFAFRGRRGTAFWKERERSCSAFVRQIGGGVERHGAGGGREQLAFFLVQDGWFWLLTWHKTTTSTEEEEEEEALWTAVVALVACRPPPLRKRGFLALLRKKETQEGMGDSCPTLQEKEKRFLHFHLLRSFQRNFLAKRPLFPFSSSRLGRDLILSSAEKGAREEGMKLFLSCLRRCLFVCSEEKRGKRGMETYGAAGGREEERST